MGGEEGNYKVRIVPEVNRIEVSCIIRTGKKVMDSFRGGVSRAGWAVRSKRSIYGVEVALEFGTIIGP